MFSLYHYTLHLKFIRNLYSSALKLDTVVINSSIVRCEKYYTLTATAFLPRLK